MKFKKEFATLVKVKGSANLLQMQKQLHDFVIEVIGEVVNPKDKVDFSLIRVLCNWVENGLRVNDKQNDNKINKREIVLEEYAKLKGELSESEKNLIEQYIEDLHNHNDIKKISLYRYVRKSVSAYFKTNDLKKK